MTPLNGTPSYDQLLEENRRLRQQLAQKERGLHVDLEHDRVTLSGVEQGGLRIDQLSVHVPNVGQLATSVLKPETLLQAGSGLKLPDLSQIARYPMQVESARVQIDESAINQVLRGLPVEGAKDLSVAVQPGGKLRLQGYTGGLFSVPFRVEGLLQRTDSSHLQFSPEKTRVAGFLPVPRLLTNLFASLAAHQLSRAHVEQQNGNFQIDLGGYLPPNLKVGIQSLTTQSGSVVLEAGSQ